MLKKFNEHISLKFNAFKGKKLLLGVSGGIDSVALAHLLKKSAIDFSIVHCNFQLRGNAADEDALFVKELATQLEVSHFEKIFDTTAFAEEQGLSIQMAARELRYHWFQKLLVEQQYNYIVTAHHLNDSLETFLINFTRGTGLKGLLGVPETNDTVIRPLLPFSRKEIEDYVNEHHIQWREDSSNASTKYLRNKIRHELVPILKEINPEMETTFLKTIGHLNDSQLLVNDAITQFKNGTITSGTDGVISLDIQKMKKHHHWEAYLYEYLHHFGFTEWNDVFDLLDAQSGKQLFSSTHRLLKDRVSLLLVERSINEDTKSSQILIHKTENHIENPINLSLKTVSEMEETGKHILYVDKSMLKFPVILRKWEKGDYFYPFGMSGKKKISKFLKDEKISLIDKEEQWLLTNNEEVFWVVGRRGDERYKINENTKELLKITYHIKPN